MEWTDVGLIVGVKRHGETSVVLELMTREHGRHLGLVRGGRSRLLQPVLQPGNSVSAVWRARLEDQLGAFTVEPAVSRAARLMASPLALHGLGHLSELLHLLPERDPHPALHDMAEAALSHLDEPHLAPELVVRFELALLAEFGYGLHLDECVLSGRTDDLAYVSPKSGRAVNRDAGAPWRDRLLPLPAFLADAVGASRPDSTEMEAAFRLTGHFLQRELFGPRGRDLPDARARLLSAMRPTEP